MEEGVEDLIEALMDVAATGMPTQARIRMTLQKKDTKEEVIETVRIIIVPEELDSREPDIDDYFNSLDTGDSDDKH